MLERHDTLLFVFSDNPENLRLEDDEEIIRHENIADYVMMPKSVFEVNPNRLWSAVKMCQGCVICRINGLSSGFRVCS